MQLAHGNLADCSLHNRHLAWLFRRESAQGNLLAFEPIEARHEETSIKYQLLVPGHAWPTDRYGTNMLAKYTQKGPFRRQIVQI